MVRKQSSEATSQQQLVLLPPQKSPAKDGKVTGPFNEEMISILPPTVKWLCHSGAG
jgi:hypothetical protein